MTPQRYQRIGELFDEALERAPVERLAWLRQACGEDVTLCAEVEKLLSHQADLADFLSVPAVQVAAQLMANQPAQQVAGTQMGHYQIQSLLGAGGMGQVYLALDARLNRSVALKLLPPRFLHDTNYLRRFEREALAASALNHPNIVTVYEFSADETIPFLVTELVQGETLRQRLTHGGLPLAATLDIALQIVAALVAAHAARIIHRDLKPENVMIRPDGLVKVLDFGLAKLTEVRSAEGGARNSEAETLMYSADIPHSTAPGTVMGTAAYMSPEQARGKPVDARSDLFSFGVILYEMIARRQPFTGETINHVIVALLEKEPPPLEQNLPAELDGILKKALAKDLDERYQSAPSLLADLKSLYKQLEAKGEFEGEALPEYQAATLRLKQTTHAEPKALTTASDVAPQTSPGLTKLKQSRWAWVSAAAMAFGLLAGLWVWWFFTRETATIQSIAVLPFINVSANAELEYVSDGISESLIYNLSQLPQLKVIARSSSFRYKGQDADPQAVARALNVDAVLLGKVEQRGESLVVNVELLRAANMTQLWGERYNRRTADLLAIQNELAREISLQLRPRLSQAVQQRITKSQTTENESYRLYLQGRYLWNKRTQESYQQAIEFFRQAIDRDPNYALAWVGLADAQAFMRVRGQSGQNQYDQAKVTIQRARTGRLARRGLHHDGNVDAKLNLEFCRGRKTISPRHRTQSELRHRASLVRRNAHSDWARRRRLGDLSTRA